jgi:hypothetical protein
MDSANYIGMDLHRATISVAVLNSADKLTMESVIETKGTTILQFSLELCGNLHVTFGEGTCAAWSYDLVLPQVTKVVVCNPRKNAVPRSLMQGDLALTATLCFQSELSATLWFQRPKASGSAPLKTKPLRPSSGQFMVPTTAKLCLKSKFLPSVGPGHGQRLCAFSPPGGFGNRHFPHFLIS